MGKQTTIDLPREVAEILSALWRGGYAAYVVGGCVRDGLRGVAPHDWDVCTAARPEETKACLGGRFVDTGLKHGTVTLIGDDGQYEITTFRADGAYSDGRRPDRVTFLDDVTGDLGRRDFTINAMAYAPQTGLVDPFCGRDDLKRGLIRCVGAPRERFHEDALRILRALRFSARFGFAVEEETSKRLHDDRALLTHIAGERIREELRGILAGDGVSDVLSAYPDVLAVFLPEIAPCVGFEQRNPHHLYDVWEHTVRAVAAAPAEAPRVRLALLLHDLGKPVCFSTDADGCGHFYEHAVESERIACSLLNRLRYDNETMRVVAALVRYHDATFGKTDAAARRWLNRLGAELLKELIAVKRADAMAQAEPDQKLAQLTAFSRRVDALLDANACVTLSQLAVNGRDILALGASAGPEVGRVLKALLSRVLDGIAVNERDALLPLAKKLLSEGAAHEKSDRTR